MRSKSHALMLTMLALILPSLATAAVVTVTVANISGHLPDVDGLFEGDSDYSVTIVAGSQSAQTWIISGNNNPVWGSYTHDFTLTLDPGLDPLLLLHFVVDDHDDAPNPPIDHVGTANYAYAWQTYATITPQVPVNGPQANPAAHWLRFTVSAVEETVAEESLTWGAVKTLYR